MDLLELHEAIKDDNTVNVILNDVFPMKVKKYLTLDEFAAFVNEADNSEFNKETGEYTPGVGSIVFKLCLARAYTDLELPEDLGLAYQIINELRIVEKIEEIVGDTEQYKNLKDVIGRSMDYRRDSRIGINGLLFNIANALQAIPWEKLNGYIDEYLDPKNMQKLAKLISKKVDPDILDTIIKALR